jgi:Mrp family chromosome partitioning ATPase
MMAMTLLGGIGGAFGLAFLLEFVLDRSIKRPIDVETKLTLPFFLSIPRMKLNGAHKALGQIKPPPLLPEGDPGQTPGALQKADPSSGGNGGGENIQITPWDHANKLRPFSEALRDRLINYFEINNLTHKPKLVAVTSCGEHCGVSTVAAGLAASLSETGEGNVLLVDMNHPDGTAHHFYKGDLSCGIDEALATGTRENAMVQDKLYVVTERSNAETAPSFLPTRFKHLVPKLKASDFDYIVFDMPAVSQISLTPRLSRFMDICLLVVEAEKTDLDIVKRASALLTQSRAKVGIVLNKTQNYLPRWLHQEL